MSGAFQFLSGTLMMGFLVSALFFFRFWAKTREVIFLAFGVSFSLLAIERIVLLSESRLNTAEDHPHVYFIRLFAFLTLLLGINAKNRTR